MKRLARRSCGFAIAVLSAVFLVGPAPANAATSCPDYNAGGMSAICLYDSDNFKNLIYVREVGIPQFTVCPRVITLPDSVRNRTNSVRNRTACDVNLRYYCGTSVCVGEHMVPYSEDGVINPVNAIDQLDIFLT